VLKDLVRNEHEKKEISEEFVQELGGNRNQTIESLAGLFVVSIKMKKVYARDRSQCTIANVFTIFFFFFHCASSEL